MKYFPLTVWLFAIVLACITSLPYVVGSLSTPAGWQYSGAAAIPTGSQVDFNSHMAKIWQGSRGQWDFHLLFTHELHRGLPLVQGFYVALGALANLTPFSFPLVFHLIRFVLTIFMVLAIWAFASRFFENKSERWLVTLFGTIVAGWSWWLLAIDSAMVKEVGPIEFWLFDAFNLLGALYFPHFVAGVILQIVVVLSFDRWARSDARVYLLVLTLALAAESIVQPYVILLLLPLLFMLTAYHLFHSKLLTWRRAGWLLIPLALHSGLVFYQYVAISGDPIWANFTDQNQTRSPLVTYYLLGYLPFIIPIAVGARTFMLNKADDHWWLPIIWVGLVAMLLYAPLPTQRRYLLGAQTPLAVLAAYGWARAVLPRIRRTWRLLVTIGYFALASVALIGLLMVNATALSEPFTHTDVFYQPGELQAYAWLEQNTSPADLVLTTFNWDGQGSGGRLVAATGQRVFMGHWIETAFFNDKINQIKQFYDPVTSDEWRRDFLKQIDARYVWYDESARSTGSWDPVEANYLERVFESDSVIIWKVK